MQHDAVSTAEAVVHLMEADRFAEIDELRVPALRNQVSADALRDPWQDLITTYGPVTRVGTPSSESAGPNTTMVRTLVTCDRGAFAVVMAVDDAGGLQGLQFAPPEAAEPVAPWQPPSYVDPASFTEESVTVASEPWATPGTLSVPNSPRPVPAVVLLAGSGPADRDATIGRNKMMKDLAWGLASQGIAALRFDKVTYTHREAFAGVTDLTVVDEYVKPVVAAIQLLRDHPSVDPALVFVLGHSQGGTVAPASRPRSPPSQAWWSWPAPHSRCITRSCANIVTSQPFASRKQTSTTIRPSGRSPDRPRWSTPSIPPHPHRMISRHWAFRPHTGSICAATTPSRWPRSWANQCSSCRVAATTR